MIDNLYSRRWFYLLLLIFSGWIIYLLSPVLIPFLIAALIAYLADPVTDRLQARGLSRIVAVCIVFLFMMLLALALLLILMPLLQEQFNAFFNRLPIMIGWVQDQLIPTLARFIGVPADAIHLEALKNTLMNNWRDVGNVLTFVLGRVSHSGQAIIIWLTYLILIPVVTFYLLRDWDLLLARICDLIPRTYEPVISTLAKQCDQVLAEFLRGQLLVMSALGFIYSLGLWLAGVEFALLIGMLAGIVSFVPYLGGIIGISIAAIVAFMQYQDILHLVYVAMVFALGQLIEGMVLSPLLLGERIGLHPVAVIFAVMAGGQLFGFVGILLALPVAAIVMVLLRYMHAQYMNSELYSP